MEDLIAQITEKTGVTAEKAKEIVGVTTDWMKDKLPEDLVTQVASALSGAGEMASSAAGSAADVASGAASTATEKAEGLWDKARDTVTGFASSKDE